MGERYRDMSLAITPVLDARLDAIARGMPEFHIARFHIRFTTLHALGEGDFKIIEINGAGSEAINFFDRDLPFFTPYRGFLAKSDIVFPYRGIRLASLPVAQLWQPIPGVPFA